MMTMGTMAEVTRGTRLRCFNGLMQFNHDNMTGVALAADLANIATAGTPTCDDVQQLLVAHQIRRSDVTTTSRAEILAWGLRLHAVFAQADTVRRCEELNELLTCSATRLYLTSHDGLRPHLHFMRDDDDLVRRLMAVTAGGLALFLVDSEGLRLGQCSRETCSKVFVDTSRNGRRAYCSPRCGNHDAVERHRNKHHRP